MRFKFFIVVLSLSALVSACGGGSSNSGGGIVNSDGFYVGTQTITITALGVSDSATAEFEMTVVGSTVEILDPDVTISGTLSNGSFTAASVPVSFVEDGVACSLSLVYSGTIGNNTTSGTIGGTIVCTDGDSDISGAVSGDFNGVLGTNAARGSQLNIQEILLQSMRSRL